MKQIGETRKFLTELNNSLYKDIVQLEGDNEKIEQKISRIDGHIYDVKKSLRKLKAQTVEN
jgi:hypothetical protein